MKLGREQSAAAVVGGGPVRVVAGAGTGKTAVIAERYRRLVARGASPESILVMTFTERAAAEMRNRIEALIETPAPAVGTFHSIALGWLRADGRSIGVPAGFRILAGADRWILARELMWKLGDAALTGDERPDDLVAPALRMLERLKQELVPFHALEMWARTARDREKALLMKACVRLFRAYEKECRRLRVLDFEDLLLLAVRMLEANPTLQLEYSHRYPHVLVDEYQDLNLAQERLVELIARGGAPFIVGDDDQSIYRFRGASRASLERFQLTFPSARTVTLGRNHRSSRRIVAAASALIGHNPDRLPKHLRSDQAGAQVELWSCPDGFTEADAIAEEASRLVEDGTSPSSIAVLCRTNAIARPIAVAMASHGLPHVVVGGHGFHDRAEIKDVIAMLRLLRRPDDAIALERVATRPAAADVMRVLEGLAGAERVLDVRDLLFELMDRTGYLDVLIAGAEVSEAARITANVSRFAESVAEFCETSPDHSLDNYLRHLELVLASGEDESPLDTGLDADAIYVMTIHQAKGLEFDAVFVPALVEGRLPQSGRSPRFELPPAVLEPLVHGREDVIAEERRLLYVAMTRARHRLFLTHASHYEGGRRWRESRFLDEVRSAGPRSIRTKEFESRAPAPPTTTAQAHDGRLQLSFSAITAYRDCPRQYWYRYERRISAPQTAEAVHGVMLHEVLRRAGESRREGKEVTAGLLRSIHGDVWSTSDFPDQRRSATFKRNGAAQLEAFRRTGGFNSIPAYLEQPFTLGIDGWSLRGVIDRIDRTASAWKIVDYKSGRPLARRTRDLQLSLYALGAASALALEPVGLEVVYLASGERVAVESSGSLADDARAQGAEVADGIRAGRFEPRPDRRRCRLCAYRLACAEAL